MEQKPNFVLKFSMIYVIQNVVIKPGSQMYDVWKGGKVPIYFEVKFFSFTSQMYETYMNLYCSYKKYRKKMI